jgi:chemotaxis protein methyltransferase CheR
VTDVEDFRALVAERTGLRFGDDKLPMMEDLLRSRMRETGETSAPAYLERLRSRPQETQVLARGLTVSETYFLRNADQFRALESIVRKRMGSGSRLRLLSAGCSSGEEPYSMAIAVRESRPGRELDADILGFDLNPDALERARAGEYSPWSLRETPVNIQQKYFRENGRSFVLDECIRERVRFEERNLIHPDPDFWRPDSFDVVYCRNVIMYFSPEKAREVVRRIASSLSPGGYLFLGHAENLRGLSRDFHLLHTHGTFYYQRRSTIGNLPEEIPGSSTAQDLPAARFLVGEASWFDAIAASTGRIEELARGGNEMPSRSETPLPPEARSLDSALGLVREERFREALALLAGSSDGRPRDPERLLLRAVLLATSGEPDGAEELAAELLEIDELNAGAHYVLALCREHRGDSIGAVEHDRVAVYLDPDFAMPHLHLGLLARRAGDREGARRELDLARDLLSREDGARLLLFGGGFGRDALIRLCGAELKSCGGQKTALLRQLEGKNAELEALNRELETLAYSVSHDLRQPLRAIDGFSKMLVDRWGGELEEGAARYLERVRSAVRRMNQLIEGLLVLSRVHSNEIQRKVVSLDAIARRVVDRLQQGEPSRRVECVIPENVTASADPRLIESVLENLLGNAWKFTARREDPRIEVRVESGDEGPVYSIADNGVGFKMEYAHKLFGPFQRLHSESDFPGTGIGLATVQRIIRRHGGRIWAESAPEGGASFFFTLGSSHGS